MPGRGCSGIPPPGSNPESTSARVSPQLRRHLRRRARRQEPAHGPCIRRPLPTVADLVGITAATSLVHAFSVAAGAVVGRALPTGAINIVAGLAFFGFAAWTVRGDHLDDDETARARRSARSVVAASAVAFFLAELGDKTMLATITLATTEGALGTWVGSTLGMVAADALAIMVGGQLGKRLPERAIRIGAAISFVAFGVVLVVNGVR